MADSGYINPLSPSDTKEIKKTQFQKHIRVLNGKVSFTHIHTQNKVNKTVYYMTSLLSPEDVKSWKTMTFKGVVVANSTFTNACNASNVLVRKQALSYLATARIAQRFTNI